MSSAHQNSQQNPLAPNMQGHPAQLPGFRESFSSQVVGMSPYQYAFAQPPMPYHLPQTQPPRIDPALVTPLPEDSENDFLPVNKILPKVAHSVSKTAGGRRPAPKAKGKGKEKTYETLPKASKRKSQDALGLLDAKRQKGRTAGVTNYQEEDIEKLLDILDIHLPVGAKGWNSVGDEFTKWAEATGRSVRTARSLELKYKQLIRMDKPTGDAECPPYIDRAHAIEHAIQEKGGTRCLDDEDIVDDAIDISSEEDVVDVDESPAPKKVIIKTEPSVDLTLATRRPANDRLPLRQSRTNRNAGQEFLANITSVFNPTSQAQRGEERATRSLQANQIFSLTSQLRQSQNLVENLRDRLATVERERNDAERRADRAELSAMMLGARRPSPRPPRYHDRRQREDTYFAGGGHAVRWVGGSDDEDPLLLHLRTPPPGTRRYTCPPTDEAAPQHFSAHAPDLKSTEEASLDDDKENYVLV